MRETLRWSLVLACSGWMCAAGITGCLFGGSSQGAAGGQPEGGAFEGGPLYDGSSHDGGSTPDAAGGGDGGHADGATGGDGGAPAPAPGTCVPTGSMASARAYALSGTLKDGRVLVAGGTTTGNDALTGAEIYDPTTGAFSPTGSLAAGRWSYPNPLVPLPDGRFLVAGGADANCAHALASAELYDPTAGTWSPTGSLGVARHNAIFVPLGDGHVLARGGYSQLAGACGIATANALTSAEVYDPAAGTFSPTADGATPRAAAASTRLADGTALVVDGESFGNSPFNSTAEVFGEAGASGGSFTWSGAVPGSAGYGYAFVLPSGKALVSGSYSSGTVSLFNPSAHAFTAGPADLISAGGGCGVRLKSGDVFLATGLSGATHTAQTELYEASAGTWVKTGDTSVARWVCAMAELPDGNVLVAGGNNPSGAALATAEVCNPHAP